MFSLRGVPSEMKQDGEDGRVRLFQELPGTYYRVIKSYNPTLATHIQTDLPLEKGTLVEGEFNSSQRLSLWN